MNTRMDQLFKALLTLTVILMFAAALISAQARANLDADAMATGGFAATVAVGVVLDEESLRRLESLPHVIDTVLALPIVVDLGTDELAVGSPGRGHRGIDDGPAQ